MIFRDDLLDRADALPLRAALFERVRRPPLHDREVILESPHKTCEGLIVTHRFFCNLICIAQATAWLRNQSFANAHAGV